LATMRSQMVMGSQGVDQVEMGGPYIHTFVCIPRVVYIHTYIYIYIYIYYKYLHTGHMVTFQMLRLYTLILTINIKDTFL